ncbi:MAG: hypothetical protein HYW79_02785 [Parcubacteria group bacterium]|nr:hypothetical protein [Parcubacteria group bacterium]
MTKFTKQKTIFLFFIFYFLFPIVSASAARLYFEPSSGNFSLNETLAVDLKIDTEDQIINSVEGHLNFSSDVFSVEKISNGNSIISFWVVPAKAENGEITFAGVIPGGYQSQSGLLLKIFLKPKKEGKGEINIMQSSLVLLNDGQGTPAGVKISNLQFLISNQSPSPKSQVPSPKDTESPEAFTPQLGRDTDIFDGQWFVVFTAQDKGGGISRYEIAEKRGSLTREYKQLPWQTAESPYVLKDQKLKSYIYVKAVDRAENITVVYLSPLRVPWYKKPLVDIVLGIIILIVLLLTIRWLWPKIIHLIHE